ncbi:MAG: VapC toxin family PIN domain ribonuclease [Acidimicrobiales bacterium]
MQDAESDALDVAFDRYVATGAVVISSSMAWVEVSRALRAPHDSSSYRDEEISSAIERALGGVAERLITGDVIGLARRVGPPLRALDAIHLASRIVLDVDKVVVYDDRMAEGCRENGLAPVMRGR